jgi:hypothetical protein
LAPIGGLELAGELQSRAIVGLFIFAVDLRGSIVAVGLDPLIALLDPSLLPRRNLNF